MRIARPGRWPVRALALLLAGCGSELVEPLGVSRFGTVYGKLELADPALTELGLYRIATHCGQPPEPDSTRVVTLGVQGCLVLQIFSPAKVSESGGRYEAHGGAGVWQLECRFHPSPEHRESLARPDSIAVLDTLDLGPYAVHRRDVGC